MTDASFASAVVGWFTGLAAVAAPIIGGFAWVEGTLSKDAKLAATNWLRQSEFRNLPWREQFLSMFDRVFGKRLLRWKSFWRSAIVSVVSWVVLLIVWYSVRPETFASYLEFLDAQIRGQIGEPQFIGVALFFLIGINIPGDYVSLIFSRHAMGILRNSRSIWASASTLVLATLACILGYLALTCVVVLAAGVVIFGADAPIEYFLWFLQGFIIQGLDFSQPLFAHFENSPGRWAVLPSGGIFVYSSLFSVAWMWLFLASGWTVRLLYRLDPIWQKLKWVLDIEGHPLRSLGIVAGVIGAVMFSLVKLAVG